MRQAMPHTKLNLDSRPLKIGIVMSRFNETISQGLFDVCIKELYSHQIVSTNIDTICVPGALEIPLVLQRMARTGKYDALIAIGAVIRGETYHFELVSNESAAGITRVTLDFTLPIVNAILTTDTEEQALHRIDEKGRAAARVAIEMAMLNLKNSD